MKTAICYYSRHHGNTLKVLEAMAQGNDINLIDVTARMAVHLEEYDCIGFASGIYYSKFQKSVLDFAGQYLPEGKDVFFVYTCGSMGKGYTKAIAEAAAAKKAHILGEYGCRGFDTFGPFKLVGGIAKGHPDADDLQKARDFYQSICRER
ncbi:MAG: flavodoxin family protein [Dysosmobacter sp.]